MSKISNFFLITILVLYYASLVKANNQQESITAPTTDDYLRSTIGLLCTEFSSKIWVECKNAPALRLACCELGNDCQTTTYSNGKLVDECKPSGSFLS